MHCILLGNFTIFWLFFFVCVCVFHFSLLKRQIVWTNLRGNLAQTHKGWPASSIIEPSSWERADFATYSAESTFVIVWNRQQKYPELLRIASSREKTKKQGVQCFLRECRSLLGEGFGQRTLRAKPHPCILWISILRILNIVHYGNERMCSFVFL